MNRPLQAIFTLVALLSAAPDARAQACPPGVTCWVPGVPMVTGARGAQVVITIGPPPPPRQIVIVRPPPPPQVVVVRPPPPPRVVVVRQQPVYYAPAQPVQQRTRGREAVSGKTGLRFYVAGASGGGDARRAQLGGVGGAVRLRPRPHFGIDLGAAMYAGTDYAGRERVEVPLTVDFLAFLNPRNKAQFYLLGGIGSSFAYERSGPLGDYDHAYTYLGAQAGAGLEIRFRPGLALNFDVRGFVRTQPNGAPEFQRVNADGALETTRTSAGAVGTLGLTVYL